MTVIIKGNLLAPVPREEVEPVPPPEPPYVTAGPPFPQYPSDEAKYGISILDYFAAHALTGLCMRADNSIDNLKENGAKDAYWIAAMMVNLRAELVIAPTPAPPEPLSEPVEEVVTAAQAVYRMASGPPSPIPPEYAPQPFPEKKKAAP